MSQQSDVTYTIYQAEDSAMVTLPKLAAACAAADVVFFGEEHNDSLTHVLQDSLLRHLHSDLDRPIALSMEMFETDVQLVVDEYLAGIISLGLLKKDARTWNNYETDYHPMVEFSKEKQIPIIAANAPRRYVRLVSKQGQEVLQSLSKAAKRFLPKLPFDTLEGRYFEKFQEIMGDHAAGLPPNMYLSQNLWDATMAYRIFQFWRKNKDHLIYHLCGRFHSDERLGTVAHLQQLKSGLAIITITCITQEEASDTDTEALKRLADYVIVR